MTVAAPKLTEAQFQAQVTQLAELLGWEWMWVRPMRTKYGEWRTGTSGTMAKGWPDLCLVRPRDHRLIFAELKRDGMSPTPEQQTVLEMLHDTLADERTSVHVWHPSDWEQIERILR